MALVRISEFLSSNSVPTMLGICWFCHSAELRQEDSGDCRQPFCTILSNGIPRFYHFIPCDKGQNGMLARKSRGIYKYKFTIIH